MTDKLNNYLFTTDWVSFHFELWNRYLAIFKGKSNLRMLEVGSYEGRSAIWFLEHILTDPTSSIVCVDRFHKKEIEDRFKYNIRQSGFNAKVTVIRDVSKNVLPTLDCDSFDIIYIDGSHVEEDVAQDASDSWKLLKVGGMIVFDDYLWGYPEAIPLRPQFAIDRFLETMGDRITVLSKFYQVIIRRDR